MKCFIFKRFMLSLVAFGPLLLLAPPLKAQAPSPENPTQYQTDSEWPGVHLQLTILKRITPTRLMAVIRVQATNQTPAGGVFLGLPQRIAGPLPPAKDMKGRLQDYFPTAYELDSATMKDEVTGVSYPAVAAITPPGKAYFPSGTAGLLLPGQMRTLSLQFDVPPPLPPPSPGEKPRLQTLTFSFPKGLKPIVHVPLPPAETKPNTP